MHAGVSPVKCQCEALSNMSEVGMACIGIYSIFMRTSVNK